MLYTVSSCGHLACYTCLKSWFLNAPPLLSGDNEDVRKVEGRKKPCPCCRGIVEGQPILVKDFVVVVRTSGLAGAFLTCITIGGGFPRGGYFIKVGLESCWGDLLGFGMEGPLAMGFLDEVYWDAMIVCMKPRMVVCSIVGGIIMVKMIILIWKS